MDASGDNGPVCMWQPDSGRVTNMDRFRKRVNENFNENLSECDSFISVYHALGLHMYVPTLLYIACLYMCITCSVVSAALGHARILIVSFNYCMK